MSKKYLNFFFHLYPPLEKVEPNCLYHFLKLEPKYLAPPFPKVDKGGLNKIENNYSHKM